MGGMEGVRGVSGWDDAYLLVSKLILAYDAREGGGRRGGHVVLAGWRRSRRVILVLGWSCL